MERTLTRKNELVGLFIVGYQIGGDKPGAPLFKVHLTVHTPTETINGLGQITQAIHPPLDVSTKLEGNYTYMTVMPHNVHILVTATGYPLVQWPQHTGIGPVILPNVHLQMVLSEDWKTGTASYKYIDNNGKWHKIEDAPVKLIASNAPLNENKEGNLVIKNFSYPLKIGEVGCFSGEESASTGYSWKAIVDNSGVYELAEKEVHPQMPPIPGASAMIIWKFRAVKEGKGSLIFELYTPGKREPIEKVVFKIEVTK